MRTLFAQFAAALLAWLPATPAAAQESAPECTVDTARPLSVREAHTADRVGECVSIEGVFDAGKIFHDRAAFVTGGSFGTAPDRLWLQRSDFPRGEGPMRARIVGTLRDCGAIYAAMEAEYQRRRDGGEEPQIYFVGGICHYTTERYLDPIAVTYLDFGRVLRPTEAEVPAERRELVAIDAESPLEARVLGIARNLGSALYRCDPAAFYRASYPDIEGLTVDYGEGYDGECDYPVPPIFRADGETSFRYEHLVDDWDRVREAEFFAPDMSDPGRRPYRLFSARQEEDEAFARLYYACWCTGPDCNGKWPVRIADTGVREDRPYFCVSVESFLSEGESVPSRFEPRITTADYAPAEPNWAEPDRAASD